MSMDMLKEKWANLSPKQRQAIGLGGLFAVMVASAGLLTSETKSAKRNPETEKLQASNIYALNRSKDVTTTQIAGAVQMTDMQLKKLISGNELQAKKNAELEEAVRTLTEAKEQQSVSGATADLVQEVQALRADLEAVKSAPGTSAPALNDPLNGGQVTDAPAPPAPPPPRKISVISSPKQAKQQKKEEGERIAYMPAGSMFEGRLLNGMDAPTSQVTIKNPVPAVIRVKTEAVLPNAYKYNVKECFLVVGGHGVLATERAQLRLETLSCVKDNGEVIEQKAEGYVVGEDGKVGLRGRLVSKQGAMLAKAMMGGFLAGLGDALKPNESPTLNLNADQTDYISPSMSGVGKSAAFGGLSNAANMIAQFYLDMASQMFPVVEIDATRKATVVLVKGLELRDLSVTKKGIH